MLINATVAFCVALFTSAFLLFRDYSDPPVASNSTILSAEVPSPPLASVATTGWKATLDNVEAGANIAQSAITILAIIVGGIWTYFIFVKNRVLMPHLEAKVMGRVFGGGGGSRKCLVVTAQLKNIGSSKVDIVQEGTLIGLYLYEPKSDKSYAAEEDWSRSEASPILKNHHWIEPGEMVEEPVLFVIPDNDDVIYKALFRVNTPKTTLMVEAIIEADAGSEKVLIADPRGEIA